MTDKAATGNEIPAWDSRARRVVTVYVPMALFVIILLFPFYWMTITAFKPDYEMENYKDYSPFWVHSPTLHNFDVLLFHTQFPRWMLITMVVAVGSTIVSIFCSVLAAYAIERLRFRGSTHVALAIYLAYLVPPTILFIPLATIIVQFGLYNSPISLILTYPTFLIPFCTWLLIGYFKSIPYELEECALVDGASRMQILRRIILPLSVPGLISAGIFAFTLSWNEFIYALAFIQSTGNKTVPVAVLTELVTGDVYQWGALMAGALLGSVPVALFYSFFVEYYVSSLTGAVKE
ncbi:MAG: carbohydrate ABC transporter permease [Acetobacteraceae bacterium]